MYKKHFQLNLFENATHIKQEALIHIWFENVFKFGNLQIHISK